MPTSDELEDLRNEVLRKIGRNVLNLQKMEGMLKSINAHSELSGNAEDLRSIAQAQEDVVSRHTMGRLVQAYIQSVYSDQAKKAKSQNDGNKVSFSFSFKVEGHANLAAEREKALMSIVKERNQLVHKDLLEFNQSSLDSCIEMCTRLDAQHERIQPEYALLQTVFKTFHELRLDWAEYMKSDAFRDELLNRNQRD